jgi:hypothetical protein
MSVVVDMRRDDTNGIMATLLRDSAGKSIDESETSAGKIQGSCYIEGGR